MNRSAVPPLPCRRSRPSGILSQPDVCKCARGMCQMMLYMMNAIGVEIPGKWQLQLVKQSGPRQHMIMYKSAEAESRRQTFSYGENSKPWTISSTSSMRQADFRQTVLDGSDGERSRLLVAGG